MPLIDYPVNNSYVNSAETTGNITRNNNVDIKEVKLRFEGLKIVNTVKSKYKCCFQKLH